MERTDLELLVILTEQPLWKKQAADRIDGVSLQTVGRRIEKLLDRNLIQARIIRPDGLNREQAIGYTTTEQGEDTVKEYRICTDCGTIKHASEHRHTFKSAWEYLHNRLQCDSER